MYIQSSYLFPYYSGLPPGMASIDSQSRMPFPVPIPATPHQPTQAWHQLVQPELRQHLVKKL